MRSRSIMGAGLCRTNPIQVRLRVVSCLIVAVGLTSANAPASEFITIDPGGAWARASGVSADGSVVVAWGGSSSRSNIGWRWTREEGIVPLPTPTGFNLHLAPSLSSDGRVIVGAVASSGFQAYRWPVDNGIELLGVPEGYQSSQANAVSGTGDIIVGYSRGPNGNEGWLWTEDGGFEFLPNELAIPRAISADGRVVSGSGFRWTVDEGAVSIGIQMSFVNRPISADGSVLVGQSGAQAVRWTESDGVENLGMLHDYPSHTQWDVHAVSADGAVALGRSYSFDSGIPSDQHAFVWDEVHGMRELETVLREDYGLTNMHPWGLGDAFDISADRRTIIGSAKTGRRNGGDEESWIVYLDEPIGPPLPESGDYNADGKVGQPDLNLVLGKWGQAGNTAAFPWINDLPTGSIDQNELNDVVLNWPTAAGPLELSLGLSNGALTADYDLKTNPAIIDYPSSSPAATVRQQILSGRGGPGLVQTWNGNGITSSTAAAANATEPESRSIGYAENSTLPLGPYTNFRGQLVDDTSLLIAYTRTGDANLDGVVNDEDVTIVSATYAPGAPQPHWALGDFDYNGFVDDADVTLLGAFYDPNAAPLIATEDINGVAAVPEPSTLGLLTVIGLVALFAVRFRR